MAHRTNPSSLSPATKAVACLLALLFAACSEFADEPGTRGPRRAVESPLGLSNPNSEVMGRAQGTIELMRVDLPNTKDDVAQVHTIGDTLATLSQPPAAQRPTPPATAPAAEPAAIVDAPLTVVEKRNAADTLVPTLADGKTAVLVISETGIGSATLQRTGDTWPATITFQFSHGTRPFTRLEGFTAHELTDAGGTVTLRTEINRDAATATITIPGFARSARIGIQWVDMYR